LTATQTLKESILETLLIIKACLTSFWFWLPTIFAGYMFLQLWMFFYIHPLTLAILPIILSIYLTIEEEKRVKAQYGLDNIKQISASDPIGSHPRNLKASTWNAEKVVEEYKRLLRDKKKKAEQTKS